MSDVIEGTAEDVTEIPSQQNAEPMSVELAPRARRSEVIRPLNADDLAASFTEYQSLLPKLLTDSDYQSAEAGKRFVKKSGWRKIATAFDLDVVIVCEEVERDQETGRILRAKTTARATAPSGRVMDGDGYCTIEEFTGKRGRNPKLENDLRGTAATRAKNRAISDLVGMGEVSAEEVGQEFQPAAVAMASPEWVEACRNALWFLTGGSEEVFGTALRAITGDGLPQVVAEAIVNTAKAMKAAASHE